MIEQTVIVTKKPSIGSFQFDGWETGDATGSKIDYAAIKSQDGLGSLLNLEFCPYCQIKKGERYRRGNKSETSSGCKWNGGAVSCWSCDLTSHEGCKSYDPIRYYQRQEGHGSYYEAAMELRDRLGLSRVEHFQSQEIQPPNTESPVTNHKQNFPSTPLIETDANMCRGYDECQKYRERIVDPSKHKHFESIWNLFANRSPGLQAAGVQAVLPRLAYRDYVGTGYCEYRFTPDWGSTANKTRGPFPIAIMYSRGPCNQELHGVYFSLVGKLSTAEGAYYSGTHGEYTSKMCFGCPEGKSAPHTIIANWLRYPSVDELFSPSVLINTEGPSDLMALVGCDPSLAAFTTLFGASTPPPPWIVDRLAGKTLIICRDNDRAGIDGALKWGEKIRAYFARKDDCPRILYYIASGDFAEHGGRDLRDDISDQLAAGRSNQEIVSEIKSRLTSHVTPPEVQHSTVRKDEPRATDGQGKLRYEDPFLIYSSVTTEKWPCMILGIEHRRDERGKWEYCVVVAPLAKRGYDADGRLMDKPVALVTKMKSKMDQLQRAAGMPGCRQLIGAVVEVTARIGPSRAELIFVRKIEGK